MKNLNTILRFIASRASAVIIHTDVIHRNGKLKWLLVRKHEGSGSYSTGGVLTRYNDTFPFITQHHIAVY
jgi:hypothetical protein